MVDRDIMAGRVATIRDAVLRVRQVLPADAGTLAADRDAREIVSLNMLVAIEAAVDLAAHWIADTGLAVPGSQRELFERLAESGAITRDLAGRLAAACAMRNIIAHHCGTIDWTRVHAASSSSLPDLEALCEAVVRDAGAP